MTQRIITHSKRGLPMFDKAQENMQEFGKQWAAFGRRITRTALRATSRSLEAAARTLNDLADQSGPSAKGNGTAETVQDEKSPPEART